VKAEALSAGATLSLRDPSRVIAALAADPAMATADYSEVLLTPAAALRILARPVHPSLGSFA
jgi:hypothetical protein